MKVKNIYLDLDRTLFDTAKFMQVLFETCQQLYGLNVNKLADQMPQYQHFVDGMRYYDFFEQLVANKVDPLMAQAELLGALRGQDFIFADAKRMLNFLAGQNYTLLVLSFGKQDFQQFKFLLSPLLQRIPFTAVLTDKAKYLAKAGTASSLLIDDKLTNNLPSDCWQLLIDRSSKHNVVKLDYDHIKISSLDQVETILTK